MAQAALAVEAELTRRVERTLDEVIATFAPDDEAPSPTTLLARVGELTRSSLFLWLETSLQLQEQLVRAAVVGPSGWSPAALPLPRALVLTALAADLYLGYVTLRDRARCSPSLASRRDWDLQHNRGAARVLETATALGGMLIKAGQLASVRGDLVPGAYVEALSTLQDQVPPHPWPVVERTLTRELGRPLAEIFTRVEPVPVAAASLAQVHRAWLRPEGRPVALKLQYPEIRELVVADLAALQGIVRVLAALEPQLRLQPILGHLRQTLPLELDFRREAAALAEVRRALAHRADVVVPEVIPELSTERLLVMEFVEGVKITDRAGLERAGIEPHAVARLLNDAYADQMLRLGWLHADPHPGNLLVQPGPRLVLLDHGLTVELRPALVAGLGGMVRALQAGDIPALVAALAQVGFPVDADTDLGSLLQLAGVLLGSGGSADVGRQLGQAIGDVPLELITVGRALALLTGVTRVLDPDLDVLELVAAYA